MIITEQKPAEEILEMLADYDSVFIVGCGECATECQTGGEYEVDEMSQRLTEAGKTVTGTVVPDVTCQVLDVGRQLRKNKEAVAAADAIMVLACGAGAQAVAESIDKPVVSGVNTLFLGDTIRHGQFYEWCSACGDCVLDEFGGICPITRCTKGQMHGPCGGTTDDGKCEVNSDNDCVWVLIQERMEKIGKDITDLAAVQYEPRDYSIHQQPASRIFEPRRTK